MKKTPNRIYTDFSSHQLRQTDKARFCLAYYLIRCHAKHTAGGFNFIRFKKAVKLKDRAAKSLLSKLISLKWIIKETDENFRVVAQRSLFSGNRKNLCYDVSDWKMKSFSLKKISHFRAFLSELEAERYKRDQKAVIKGYTQINQRDKSVDKVKNHKNAKYDQLMALECMAPLVNISKTTASSYRKKQKLVRYKWLGIVILEQQDRRFHQTGKSFQILKSEDGVSLVNGNLVLHSSISKRIPKPRFIMKRKF